MPWEMMCLFCSICNTLLLLRKHYTAQHKPIHDLYALSKGTLLSHIAKCILTIIIAFTCRQSSVMKIYTQMVHQLKNLLVQWILKNDLIDESWIQGNNQKRSLLHIILQSLHSTSYMTESLCHLRDQKDIVCFGPKPSWFYFSLKGLLQYY